MFYHVDGDMESRTLPSYKSGDYQVAAVVSIVKSIQYSTAKDLYRAVSGNQANAIFIDLVLGLVDYPSIHQSTHASLSRFSQIKP